MVMLVKARICSFFFLVDCRQVITKGKTKSRRANDGMVVGDDDGSCRRKVRFPINSLLNQ